VRLAIDDHILREIYKIVDDRVVGLRTQREAVEWLVK
jgi:hypothetical protein